MDIKREEFIAAWVSEDLLRRLNAFAKQEDRTRSKAIGMLLEIALKKALKEAK